MPKKIYIIDDDPDIIESNTMILEKEGYEVGATTNPDDAEKKIIDAKADLIILDVMMKGNTTEGFELARELKKNEMIKNIPIIMQTSINQEKNYRFSDKDKDDYFMPVEEFLEKGAKPEVLINLVKKYLD